MMLREGGSRARWCAAVIAVLAVSACNTSVNGTAVRSSGGPAPGAVDTSLLDPGNYPTKPRPPLGVAGSPGRGALLEAQRLAEFVIGPWEVDPSLTAPHAFGFGPGSMPLPPTSLRAVMDPEVGMAAMSHNPITGFATAREVAGQKDLFNVVIRMPDAASASAAATEMGAARQAVAAAATPPVITTPIGIPGHPEAVASSYSFTKTDINQTWFVVDSFTAHGPYVLQQRAELAGSSIDAAAAMVGSTLDLQVPRIDAFVPTDPAQLENLPRDPSGLLAKSLPVPENNTSVNDNLTLGPHAALMYQTDPVEASKQFTDAGLSTVVHADGYVYQARDDAGAAVVATPSATDAGKPAAPVPNLAGSRCDQASDGFFTCTATVGRYTLSVWSNQLKDAHQKAAAQYLLLASS